MRLELKQPQITVAPRTGLRARVVPAAVSIAAALATSLATLLVTAACSPAEPPPPLAQRGAAGERRDFTGSWNAAGSRKTIVLGAERRGSIVHLRGPLMLAGADRPGVGFNAELIALVDSATGLVGRAVWTDERGDQVFSEVKGEGTAAQNRITGAIVGGSGRYAGATGAYEFSWRFVIEAEDGSIQGSSVGLKGHVVPAAAAQGRPSS
jgi:hypothetical protein